MTFEKLIHRNRLIEAHRDLILSIRSLEDRITPLMKAGDPQWRSLEDERSELVRRIEPIIEAYWDWVPAVVMSRCPVCRQDLRRRFDPIDLRGFWWMERTRRLVQEPEACGHFRLMTGALNLNGQPVQGGLFESRPGPDVPFVIPRILDMPTMMAVIGEVGMSCGYRAFPIAYFSKDNPPLRSLGPSWTEGEYRFAMPGGQAGWDEVNDAYDYDLDPWLKDCKVELLCPIEGLEGQRKRKVIIGNELRYNLT